MVRAEDRFRVPDLTKLADLAFMSLDPIPLFACLFSTSALIPIGLLHPFAQRLA